MMKRKKNKKKRPKVAGTHPVVTPKSTCYSILFCGIGGQGILKLAELCAYTAFFAGYHVKKSEVHGMAQRGGSVESHLRFGRRVFSPLIPAGMVDCFVALHPEEHRRLRNFAGTGCVDLFEFIEEAQRRLDEKRFVNTFMAGVLSVFLPLKEKRWMEALEHLWSHKPDVLDANKEAFLQGREAVLDVNKNLLSGGV